MKNIPFVSDVPHCLDHLPPKPEIRFCSGYESSNTSNNVNNFLPVLLIFLLLHCDLCASFGMARAIHLAELFRSRRRMQNSKRFDGGTLSLYFTREEEQNWKRRGRGQRMDVPPKSGRRRMSYPLNSLSTVDLATDIPDAAELLRADSYSY